MKAINLYCGVVLGSKLVYLLGMQIAMRFKKVIMSDVQYIHTFNKRIVKVMAIGNLLYYGVALPTWFYCT